jgi:hypothetical protein
MSHLDRKQLDTIQDQLRRKCDREGIIKPELIDP